MSTFTHEVPENLIEIVQQLIYIFESKKSRENDKIEEILKKCKLSIIKTGNWSDKFGYAEARGILTVPRETMSSVTPRIESILIEQLNLILTTSDCGLQLSSLTFIPASINEDMSIDLHQIMEDHEAIIKKINVPEDLVDKGKEMSQIYLYIYFIENCLRLFIQELAGNGSISYPTDVRKTIMRNKENEKDNKFLPLRGDSDLFYCDFIQLQKIIVNNWDIFKMYFPDQDQHWLRIKLEEIYQIRNLIAHCGYISKSEIELVKLNFRMILKQLNFAIK